MTQLGQPAPAQNAPSPRPGPGPAAASPAALPSIPAAAARVTHDQYDTLDANGVLHRGRASYEPVGGGDVGGYIVDHATGKKFHITGTNSKGEYVAPYTLHNSATTPGHDGAPRLHIRDQATVIKMLELKAVDGKPGFYSRRGFTGSYTMQRESDGSVSVFYAGGPHETGLALPPQTFHHGSWDLSRNQAGYTVTPDTAQRRTANIESIRATTRTVQSQLGADGVHRSSSGSDTKLGGSGFYTSTGAITRHAPTVNAEQWAPKPQLKQDGLSRVAIPTGNSPQEIDQRRDAAVPVYVEHTPSGGRSEGGYAFPRSYGPEKGMLYLADRAEVMPELVRKAYSAARDSDGTLVTHAWLSVVTDDKSSHQVMVRSDGSVLSASSDRSQFTLLVPKLNSNSSQSLVWEPRKMIPGGVGQADFIEDKSETKGSSGSGTAPAAVLPTIKVDAKEIQRRQIRALSESFATSKVQDRAASGYFQVPGLDIPADPAIRTNVVAPFTVSRSEDGATYFVFPRRFRDSKKAEVSGVMLLSADSLISGASPEGRTAVSGAYKNLSAGGKIETWYGISGGQVSLRSDGSVVHRASDGAAEGTIYKPSFADGTHGTLTWVPVKAELRDGRYMPKPKPGL